MLLRKCSDKNVDTKAYCDILKDMEPTSSAPSPLNNVDSTFSR